MSIIKVYNKKSSSCKVIFRLPVGIVDSDSQVCLVGEFNNWDIMNIPMKKLEGGEFEVTVNLEKDKEYQFKYLVDGRDWINEKDADRHVENEFRSENSVVVT